MALQLFRGVAAKRHLFESELPRCVVIPFGSNWWHGRSRRCPHPTPAPARRAAARHPGSTRFNVVCAGRRFMEPGKTIVGTKSEIITVALLMLQNDKRRIYGVPPSSNANLGERRNTSHHRA